jgi:hypothetical protein
MKDHKRIIQLFTMILWALWSCHSGQTTEQPIAEQKEILDSVHVDSIIRTKKDTGIFSKIVNAAIVMGAGVSGL